MTTARPPRRRLLRLSERSLLGNGLSVSPVCLGQVADPAVVPAAFNAGINFFFVSADMHWPHYEGIRRGLAELLARGKDRRDRVVVAGACYPTQPEFNVMPFAELVEAVPGLGRLDVLLAGGVYAGDLAGRWPVYQQHRRQRFLECRAVGCTFHERAAAADALQGRAVDIAFIRYNAAHPKARQEVFPRVPGRPRPLLFNFKSTLGYRTPAQVARLGLPPGACWQAHPSDHYRFALTPPEMDGVLVSLRSVREVEDLAAALGRGALLEEEEQYLMGLAAALPGAGRPQADEHFTE
jgi:hypothetical protein